jgi:hypothetical protein
MFDRAYYHSLRRLYEPDDIKLIVVAESPPHTGKYFYDKSGAIRSRCRMPRYQRAPHKPSRSAAACPRRNVTGDEP